MNLRIDAGALQAVAGHHDDAHATIQDATGSMPGTPAAGVGGERLAAIVTAVSAHASDIAVFHQATAALVRQVSDEAESTDSTVSEAFRLMQSELGE